MKLNKEEKEILKSYDNDEWKSVKDLEKRKSEYQQIAKNTIERKKSINIRLSVKELAELKAKSLEEGLPYQTLVTSIVHKYVTGKLKEA